MTDYREGSLIWVVNHIKAIEARLDNIGIPEGVYTGDVEQLRAVVGTVPEITLAALQGLIQAGTPQGYFYVTSLGIKKLFLYDSLDTSTADDNGATTIVTSDGKRYKKGSLVDLFNSPFA